MMNSVSMVKNDDWYTGRLLLPQSPVLFLWLCKVPSCPLTWIVMFFRVEYFVDFIHISSVILSSELTFIRLSLKGRCLSLTLINLLKNRPTNDFIIYFLNFIPLYRIEIFTTFILIQIPETAKFYVNITITFYFP